MAALQFSTNSAGELQVGDTGGREAAGTGDAGAGEAGAVAATSGSAARSAE